MTDSKSRGLRSGLLVVLAVILAFNFVDRLVLGLVLQDIKTDLRLSDTQLGFLTGLAFAWFYATMGIPIARWADRGNRVTIMTITTALWSVAVMLCAAVGSFWQLLLTRITVAVGEAGCIPIAHSLIVDHFTRAERPQAVAMFMLGAPLSIVIGYFLGGWLNEFYGWRATFVLLALPGLVSAVLAWLALKEPRLGKSTTQSARSCSSRSVSRAAIAAPSSIQPSLKEVILTLWTNTTFRHLTLYFSVSSFFGYGIAQWQPAFFMRSYGLKSGELGTWLAMIYGLGGLLGTYWGGQWSSRYAARNERLQLKAAAVVYSSLGAVSALTYLATSPYVAFGWMALAALGGATATAPLFATIQTLVPDRMRAMSIAFLYLCANLIGMGLGPLAAGGLSDALRSILGEESLRYALLALCPGYLWGAWHLWRGSTTVARDLEAVQTTENSDFNDSHVALSSSIKSFHT